MRINPWIEKLKKWYGKKLTYLLEHKTRVLLIAALAVGLSIAVFPFMSKEYFPSMDQAIMVLEVEGEVGSVLEETSRVVDRVEELLEVDEVQNYASFVGMIEGGEMDAAMGTGPSGPHEGSIYINLKDRRQRDRSQQEIVNDIRRNLPPHENFQVRTFDMGRAMVAAGGQQEKPLQVDVFGPDLGALKEITGRIMERMGNIEGIFDVTSSLQEGRPEIGIRIDRLKAAEHGITLGEAAREVNRAARGTTAARFRQGGREYDINVILNQEDRDDIQKLGNIPLSTPDGRTVNLLQIASLQRERGPVRLIRENRRRKVAVSANYEGRGLSGAQAAVEREIEKISLPAGYSVQFGGEVEDMRDMFITLAQLFALAVLLIYMVMAAQFESFLHPLIIMISIPLAYVGAVLLISLTGTTISMPSAMGVLILFGIIVNNAIVMIDYINQLRRNRGLDLREAVLEGAGTRLRPILMTATTTVMAMVPVAMNRMEGFEIRTAVAQSIIGGLVAGTLLTLFVIPVVYEFVENKLKS